MLTLPDSDIPTRSASGFLLRYVVPRVGPAQLIGALDRRPIFSRLVKFGDCIIGVGHGEPDLFGGQGDDILLKVGEYSVDEVKGKFIKLISCQTADLLGPDLIESGAIAFQGYSEDYLWVADLDYSSTPWDDPMAGKCLIPVMGAVNSILDGNTNQEAFDLEVRGYNSNISQETDELILAFLKWNRDHLVYLGDPNARVNPKPRMGFPLPPPPLPPVMGIV